MPVDRWVSSNASQANMFLFAVVVEFAWEVLIGTKRCDVHTDMNSQSMTFLAAFLICKNWQQHTKVGLNTYRAGVA